MTGKSTPDAAVFGPVASRRLGWSLGVDLITFKTCTLDCLYCELGPTTLRTTRRAAYRDADQVLAQVKARLAQLDSPPDYITLAGSGEPTLHSELGRVLAALKEMSPAQVAVLTNGTLLTDPAVRAELAPADLVVPSLDAATPAAFAKVNRPDPGLDINEIIRGIAALVREHPGSVWLEVLLVGGVNDSRDEVAAIARAAREIKPGLIQLGTIERPPAAPGARPVPPERLEELARLMPEPCQVIAPPSRRAAGRGQALGPVAVELCRRRPQTPEELAASLGIEPAAARALVEELVARGRMRPEPYGDKEFYRGV